MVIHVFENAQQVGAAAGQLFSAQVLSKPESVLGLATGSSPIETYQELVDQYRKGILDFSKVTTFNLDEYIGIANNHPASYHDFMDKQLFNHVNMVKENIHLPNGNAENLLAEAKSYDQKIAAAGGIDLQLLGIGTNAHIGFNEPDHFFTSGCHVVDLTPSTIEANTRFFNHESEVPRQAISLGIGPIMSAKKIVLIATGQNKAQAIYDTIHGEVTPMVPASILQAHPNVIFLLDKEAASQL